MNVPGVLQEAGDADPSTRTRSQVVQIEYFIIIYTSTFIRFSDLHQEFCVHCIVIRNDRGWHKWGMVGSYQGVAGGTGSGYYLIVFFISVFVFLSLMSCLFFRA